MRVSDFIAATSVAESLDEISNVYCRALAELGYDRVMYSVLAHRQNRIETQTPAIMRNYPDDWVGYYVEKGYVERDPVRKACLVTRSPFLWQDVARMAKFPGNDLKIFPEANEAGLRNGVAIPLHGPAGEVMGVGMACSQGGVDARAVLGELNALTVLFHTAYACRAFPQDVPASVSLTPREREILQLCLHGKSSWAIGELLHVAEKTVEWHLSRVYSKLGVSGRIPAVVKALNLGLIFQ